MSQVESRIVTMKFNNGDFKSGVSDTLSVLGKLKSAFSFKGSKQNVADLNAEMGRFNLNPLTASASGVSKSFLAMSTIAITALANITNKAVDSGIRIAKALTIDQISAGFAEYELKLGSIQTILANTERYGTSLKDVNSALNELNEYADKTIYNFGDMTKNIGLFTNAGIRVEDATSMIQGFSNVAAASGTSAQGAAGAAYQLSQALSAGTIRLMDWRSLTNVGMGNKNMQTSIIQIADAMGAFDGVATNAKKAAEDFNGSLEKKWLSADVMEQYLKIMAGKVTPAQMEQLGLTEKQIEALRKQAKTAEEAATKVRTFTQLIDTVQEAIGSGWAQTFEIVLGNFNQATKLFTGISKTVGEIVDANAKARNDLLKGWAKGGGRSALIEGLKAGFSALGKVMSTVKDAFREVFPATTSAQLITLTERFRDFMVSLTPAPETLNNIKRIFVGIFSALKLAGGVVKQVAGFFKDLFSAILDGSGISGNFLSTLANVGDYFTNLAKTGPKLRNFSGATEGVRTALDRVKVTMSNLGQYIQPVLDWFKGLGAGLQKAAEAAKEFGSSFAEKIKESFGNINWGVVFGGIGTGSFATIALAIRKLVKDGGLDFGFNFDLTGGFLSEAKEVLGGFTGVLTAMQQNLKAEALLKIAGALGVLALALLLLSTIPPKKLAKAMAGVAAGMTVLVGALAAISQYITNGTVAKLPVVATSMLILSAAILVLSFALKKMGEIKLGDLAKGLAGLAASLTILTVATMAMGKLSGPMLRASASMILMAVALRIMGSAVAKMGSLDLATIGKGLIGIAGALGIIIAGLQVMPPKLGAKAAGILIIAAALNVLALAVKQFGQADLIETGKGVLAIGAALVVIAGAMRIMPKNMLANAAALLILSAAMGMLASSVAKFGSMSLEQLATGIGAMAAALLVLAVALYAMSGALPGAFALTIAAAGLSLLIPPIAALGAMSWGDLVKSLVGLAGALTIIGVAAAIFGLAAPLLILGGAALVVFGAGLALVGVGALAFAKAIELAARVSGKGAKAIEEVLMTIIKFIPKAMKAFAVGVIDFIETIARSVPRFMKAFGKILSGFLDMVIENVPKIDKVMRKLMDTGIKAIRDYFPQLVQLGIEMLVKLLRGISQNMRDIVTAGGDIIVGFIEGTTRNMRKIIRAGTDLIIAFIEGVSNAQRRIIRAAFQAIVDFINGLADGVERYLPQIKSAGRRLANAIIEGLFGGLVAGVRNVVDAARRLAQGALNTIKGVFGIASPSKETKEIGQFTAQGLADGIDAYGDRVAKSSTKVGEQALRSLRASMRNAGDILSEDLDTAPKITPVLDLSQVTKDAAGIATVINGQSVQAKASLAYASSISDERAAALQVSDSQATGDVIYNQVINAPEPLTTIDIYRNTKSQLALAKEAL